MKVMNGLGLVCTNPFSKENGAVLPRFQKALRPHLTFSYRFRPSILQRRIRFENAFIPSVRMLSSEFDACAFQYIGPRNWREIEVTWERPSAILDNHGRVVWRPVVSILMMSPFSDSIVFSVHTKKTAFSKSIVFKSLHSGERFRMLRFR